MSLSRWAGWRKISPGSSSSGKRRNQPRESDRFIGISETFVISSCRGAAPDYQTLVSYGATMSPPMFAEGPTGFQWIVCDGAEADFDADSDGNTLPNVATLSQGVIGMTVSIDHSAAGFQKLQAAYLASQTNYSVSLCTHILHTETRF